MKILHVEDLRDWQEAVFEAFPEHEVVSVAKISEAQEMVRSGEFDVVICDGTVQEADDGLALAFELYDRLFRVGVFSAGINRFKKYPFPTLDKSEYTSELLRGFLEEIVN